MPLPPGQTPVVERSRLTESFDFDRLGIDPGRPGATPGHPGAAGSDTSAVGRPGDAADLLLLDTAAAWWRSGHPREEILVLDDRWGAVTLPVLASLMPTPGADPAQGACAAVDHAVSTLRVLQDDRFAERVLESNAQRCGLPVPPAEPLPRFTDAGPSAFTGVHTVLLTLPRSLETLEDWSWFIAEHAAEDVVVLAAGRDKHMSRSMNSVLGRRFSDVSAGRGRSKSRVLTARGPLRGTRAPGPRARTLRLAPGSGAPPVEFTLCSVGSTYGGTRLDPGTRLLLQTLDALPDFPSAPRAVDFGCGNGTVSAWLALRHPELQLLATDQSASAVQSTQLTAAANSVEHRIQTVRDDALSRAADSSADLIVLNPPFHQGNAVDVRAAHRLIAEAGRVLAPGGRLYCVWNSHLKHRAVLNRSVGPTEQLARDERFTVTVSTAR